MLARWLLGRRTEFVSTKVQLAIPFRIDLPGGRGVLADTKVQLFIETCKEMAGNADKYRRCRKSEIMNYWVSDLLNFRKSEILICWFTEILTFRLSIYLIWWNSENMFFYNSELLIIWLSELHIVRNTVFLKISLSASRERDGDDGWRWATKRQKAQEILGYLIFFS